ncbi:MAG TPA: FAD-dependent oxidoreductase [Thermodesulfobacteriota bacterium]|nr:FAD-dependent oxidoreductase [Thermodesulfobacteriota bacterium]
MKGSFKHLFEPVRIGKVEIKNRIALAPMGTGSILVDSEGKLGPRGVEHYLERCRGGVGLIISHASKVENEIDPLKKGAGFPLITHVVVGPLAELADAAHAFGTKIFVQLSAGFGRTANPRILRETPVSASVNPNYWDPSIICREVTTEEVERLVRAFGPAAQLLAECGIDGIELHGHEGYLFDQFTTVIWNRRTDKYGGELANRLRFPVEVLQEIKGRVGKNFPVQYRFGLKHYMKGLRDGALPGEKYVEAGRDVEEGLKMARMLEEAGFDALHVDAGCYDSWYWAHPPGYQKYGCMVDMAAEAKRVVKIPVIAVGRLDVPELAEKVIAEGKADLVAIGRGLLSDPHWTKKVEEGRQKHIRPCIGCHDGCMGRLVVGKPTSCAVNPASGREKEYALHRTNRPKKVMVIGGGVAGMEAGRVAALRGHKVVIYEKSNKLGGHVREAVRMPFKEGEQRLLDWYKTELEKLKVEIHLKTEVTLKLIREKNPAAVVVATGSKPIWLNVPGADKPSVVTASDFLSGRKEAGKRVVVAGGGQVGCEMGLWLAQQGKKVTVVEKLSELMIGGRPIPWMNQVMLLDLLKFHKVDVKTNFSLDEVTDQGAVVIGKDSRKETLPADTIIIAVGLAPERGIYHSLLGKKITNLYLIGDAREAKNIMNAIWDAYEVARTI